MIYTYGIYAIGLRCVGSLKLQVSFEEYCLLYGVLLQKRPIVLRSLLIVATPYVYTWHSNVRCICMYVPVWRAPCDALMHELYVWYTYMCETSMCERWSSKSVGVRIYSSWHPHVCTCVCATYTYVCETYAHNTATCIVYTQFVRVYIYVYIYIHIHIYTCIHVYIYVHIYIHIWISMHTYWFNHVLVCVCILYVSNIYMFIYINV